MSGVLCMCCVKLVSDFSTAVDKSVPPPLYHSCCSVSINQWDVVIIVIGKRITNLLLIGAALGVSDPDTWLCLGGRGLSWPPLGGPVKSDLSALVWELLQLRVASSVISEANSGPVHIPLGSCCYGLQNASLGSRRSCNFISKPGVRLMKQILGFAGHRMGRGRPQHPRRGWQPMRRGVLVRMKPFQPHSLSEEGDACVRVGFRGRCGVMLVHNLSCSTMCIL